MEYRYRLATDDDAEAIARIYNQGISERVATFETEERTAQDIIRDMIQRMPTHPTVVVELEHTVIGWATAGPYSSRDCYSGVAEHSVYVDRDTRSAGAGLFGLEALCAEYQKRGFWKLVSRIFPENTASLALHRRAGFREVGVYRRHGKLDGEWRDCVIVERLL